MCIWNRSNLIPLQEMLKNFLIICVIITGRNVYIQVHVEAKIDILQFALKMSTRMWVKHAVLKVQGVLEVKNHYVLDSF